MRSRSIEREVDTFLRGDVSFSSKEIKETTPALSQIPAIRSLFLAVSLFFGGLYAGCGYDGQWDLGAGYRHDEFLWSIQGSRGTPDVFAEIDWQHQEIFEVFSRYILTGWDSIYVRAQGSLGWIIQSTPVYSLFGADDREGLLVREVACKTGNIVADCKAGIGFHILCYKGRFDIAPLVGWNYAQQWYRYRDPRITDDFLLREGCLDNLRVRYRPKWNGGFVGVDNIWRVCNALTINIQVEGHWAAYRARGNWTWEEPTYLVEQNRDQFHYLECWHDCANGWGKLIQGSLVYCACENWNIGVIAGYQSFRTRKGVHITDRIVKDIDPARELIVNLPREKNCVLNPIHWRSYWFWFTLQCHF